MIIFIYSSTDFSAVVFKSLALVSSSIIGMFSSSTHLVVVGDIQASFLSIEKNFALTHINYITTPKAVNNDNFKQTRVDAFNDRVTVLTLAKQVSFFRLSDLKYEMLVMTFTNENNFFELDLAHDKVSNLT